MAVKYLDSKYAIDININTTRGITNNIPLKISEAGLESLIALAELDGSNIFVVDSLGNLIPSYLVEFDRSTPTMKLQTRFPAVGDTISIQTGGTATNTNTGLSFAPWWTAAWLMEQNAANQIDYINSYDAVLPSAPAQPMRVNGKLGFAQSFDGGDYLQVPDDANLRLYVRQIFSFWYNCKTTPASSNKRIISHRDLINSPYKGVEILHRHGAASNALKINFSADAGANTRSICSNGQFDQNSGWNHFTCVYDLDDSPRVYMYVNGVLQTDTEVGSGLDDIRGAAPITIGGEYNGSFVPSLQGELDSIHYRCEDTGLTADELQFHYDNEAGFSTNETLTIGEIKNFTSSLNRSALSISNSISI